MGKNINGSIKIGDTEMYYVSFGTGTKQMVVLPGLSDGLATVKGKKEGIYNSELYVYEGLGHGAFEEAKDFYDRIFAFC